MHKNKKKNHSCLEFRIVSYSGILLKSETVSRKLYLSFKQQGSHEIWKGLSFVNRGPLWGTLLTEDSGETVFCGRKESSTLPSGDFVPIIASDWSSCRGAGTAFVSLIKSYSRPPSLTAQSHRQNRFSSKVFVFIVAL